MNPIRCMFCQKITTTHKINAQKRINGKVITLSNTPVYFCKPCEETFLSKEAIDVFSYIKDNRLDSTSIMFDFEIIYRKFGKA